MPLSNESPMRQRPPPRTNPMKAAFWTLVAAAAVLLLYEHRAHLAGYWPLAIFLLCPLLHLWMHRGHRGHGESGGHRH